MTARVLITGVGIVGPDITGGRSSLEAFLDAPAVPSPGLVDDAALGGLVDEGERRRLSRVSRLAVAAARLALRDAGIETGDDLGLVVGTEFGDLHSTRAFADGFLDGGPGGLSALLFPGTVMNTMAAATTIAVGAHQLSLTLNAPTIAGELAVIRAAAAIAGGRVDAVVAGGVDERDAYRESILADLGATGRRGEGATFLVLEREERVRDRGGRPLGEIRGAASGALAARPHGVGRSPVSRAVAFALARSGVAPADVAAVYRSASGDLARDDWERRVVEAAVGSRPSVALAARLGGHAAVGALAVAAAAWTATTGRLPSPWGGDGGRVPAHGGPVLVHGLARGGGQAALVVAATTTGVR
jgi:3-oxoacyl-[acyl-carrier-protein] synthase II